MPLYSPQTSDESLLATIEAITQGVIFIDTAGRILLSNSSAATMFGYTKSELLIAAANALIPQGLPNSLTTNHEVYKIGPTHKRLDLVAKRKDGVEFPVEVAVSFIDARESGVVTILVITDLRDVRRMEGEILRSQKLDAVGRLAAGIAHDFRNMLMIIGGYNQMLLDELLPVDDRRKYAEEIGKATERASGLAGQLLTFGKQQALRSVIVNLNDTLLDARKMLTRLIGEDIKVLFQLEPTLWRIKADPGQLLQALFNIAANARDAMPDGGNFTIETANFRLDQDYATTPFGLQMGDYVLWSLRDTGCGMVKEQKDHIFEPFFTTKPGRGTGLGLATVYGFVKQSGGEIVAYSEEGCGSVFKIYLPRIDADIHPPIGTPETQKVSGAETILLVEDERAVRKLIGQMLEQSGYKVLEARDPVEALTAIHNFGGDVDLLLTDMRMPHMSGERLAELILERRPQTKVIYMSGFSTPSTYSNAVVLSKPFSKEALLCVVRASLDKPQIFC